MKIENQDHYTQSIELNWLAQWMPSA